jgi:SP family arabinose:H+ symporter-like MFS transporter
LIQWRVELGVAALPATLFLILLLTVPQSSRWLVTQNRIDEALLILTRMGSPDSQAEVDAIVESMKEEGGIGSSHLFDRRHRLHVFLAITIGMFNQLTGINAILYYLNDIFARAGFNKVSSDLQAVAIGATNLLFTMLAMSIIDHLGRRTLMLIGSVGTAACLAGVAAIFSTGHREGLLVWLLIGFIAAFAFSQGSVIWVYISEVFPTAVRAKGQSLGSSTHWIMNALISWAFPIVAASSKAAPFVFFSAMMVLQFIVVFFFYPETKNIVLEDMEKKLAAV